MTDGISGFRLVLASEVGDRDGIGLELTRADGERVAEVFQDADSGSRTFRQFTEGVLPVEAVEWLLSEAANRL